MPLSNGERIIPCEYTGGHDISYIRGKDMNDTWISIPWCNRCKKVVRDGNGTKAKKEDRDTFHDDVPEGS